jgi:hypothetical protein
MPPIIADDDEDDLHPIDKDALTRALGMARRERGRGEQLDHMLARDPWEQVARFAVYCCQCDNLYLKPWQSPPMWVDDMEATLAAGDDGVDGKYAAAKLLQRMLDANLSIYEPDPITALEHTKRTKKVDEPKQQPSPKL